MSYRIVFFFFVFLVAISCKRDEKDKTKPVFESLQINKKSFEPGEVLEIQFAVSDNENLGQVRSRISQAFAKSFGDWKDVVVKPISGEVYSGVISFAVPDTARAGYYQIATQVSDLGGNTSIDSLLYFNVLQPGFAPEINDFQTFPAMVGDVLYLNANDTLHFSGNVTDDNGLKSISINLKSTEDKNIKTLNYNIPDSTLIWDFAEKADTIFPVFQNQIPARLIVKAADVNGNQTRLEWEVKFEE